MSRMCRVELAVVLAMVTSAGAAEAPLPAAGEVPGYLQDISVTIKADSSEGSGVVKTRELDGKAVNFVWTAAHVVDGLRQTEEVIDPKTGTKRTKVSFRDAAVVKELIEDGRRVGELKMDATVLRYSKDEDLALLRIRKRDFVKSSVVFYTDEKIPTVGTDLYHVGSLLGQMGSNSLTSGIVSQIGRTIEKQEFDQSTCVAFPGCLTADTTVQLASGEEIPIVQVKEGDEVLAYDARINMADGTWSTSIANGDYVLSFQTQTGLLERSIANHNLRPVTKGRVLKVWPTGIKPILRISTRNKSIRATANHPFVRVTDVRGIGDRLFHIAQWCPAGDIKPGDIVGVMKSHVPYRKSQGLNFTKTFGPKENHLPMMRLLGFYVGDGHSRLRDGQGGEVNLYTFDDADFARYASTVRQCFNANPMKGNSPSGTYVRISSVAMATMLKDVGVTGVATTKRVPEWVFECPPEFQREFLEGYVDADGHRRRDAWGLCAANENLIYDLYTLAMNLGMGTSNVSHRERTAHLSGRNVTSTCWECEIYPEPSKQGAQMNGTTDLLPRDLKFERIASVEPDGEEMTYDMEVKSFHNFFANGFLVHNSSGGGVYLRDGRYVGMLVRGAGEGFNLMVPIRRMARWAKSAGVEWAIDDKVKMPSSDELDKILIEDTGTAFGGEKPEAKEFPTLIRRSADPAVETLPAIR